MRRRPQIDLEEYSFLERIFSKTKPEERTWAKLVNIDTVHWYCDGPEPTEAAIKYEKRTRQRKSVTSFFFLFIRFDFHPSALVSEMDDAKRRAAIKSKAVKNKGTDIGAMGTGSSRPLAKRPMPRVDRDPKKQKVSTEPVIGLMAEGKKTVPPAKPGAGKGLMVAPPGSQKKPPVLLREDPKYALEKITSIIGSEDYEDLGNHSTEAMGETGLFNIAQVSVRHHSHFNSLFNFLLSPICPSGYAHDEGSDGPSCAQ